MCDCIKKITESLQEKYPGTAVGAMFLFDRETGKSRVTAAITMEDGPSQGRGKPRIKPPAIIPTYCPFCGQKYPDDH